MKGLVNGKAEPYNRVKLFIDSMAVEEMPCENPRLDIQVPC
jgi:hypothetical protein